MKLGRVFLILYISLFIYFYITFIDTLLSLKILIWANHLMVEKRGSNMFKYTYNLNCIKQ